MKPNFHNQEFPNVHVLEVVYCDRSDYPERQLTHRLKCPDFRIKYE